MSSIRPFSWSNNWQYLILPQINAFGVITNVLNVIVFLNPKLEDPTFKYMLATSLNDILYLVLTSWNIFKYCSECPLYSSFITQVYLIYLNDYFTSSLALFNILVDIVISFQRYMILINKSYCLNLSYKWILFILMAISLTYYFPLLFFKDILIISNTTMSNTSDEFVVKYAATKNKLGVSDVGRILPIVMTVGRIFLGVGVLTVINVLNAYEFRKRFLKKSILFF